MMSRMWHIMDKCAKKKLIWLTLLLLVCQGLGLASVALLVPIVNSLLKGENNITFVWKTAFMGFIVLLNGILKLLCNRLSISLTVDSAKNWADKLYELYAKENLFSHNEKTPSQAINNIKTDTSVSANALIGTVNLIINAVVLAVYFAIIIYSSPLIGTVASVLMLVFTAILYFRNLIFFTRFGKEKRMLELRTTGLISIAYGSYKELKIDQRKDNLMKKYRNTNEQYAKVQKDYVFATELMGIVLDSLKALLFFLLSFLLISGINLTNFVDEASVFAILFIRILPYPRSIVTALTSFQYGMRSYEAVYRDIKRYEELKEQEHCQQSLRYKKLTLKNCIKIRGLTFHYPNGKNIYEEASIDIPAGCSVALVGASGSGKTTFLDLLLGLLVPQTGEIIYDDYDLVQGRDSDGPCQVNLGSLISYIPQTVFLNSVSIRDNVVFMSDRREDEDAHVVECLKRAQIWEDVQNMPNGLDTVIGENGFTISGGQRQRIALARALYKDFEFLIMDEATAALDEKMENDIIESLQKLKGNKTLLIVTHHQSLADKCDHIYRVTDRKFVKER